MSNHTFFDRGLRTGLGALVLALAASTTAYGAGESVAIDPFDLAPGASVTIELEVQISNPTSPGATQVCNQGSVPSENFGGAAITAVATDDPAVGGAADATCTQLLIQADLSISKADSADPVNAASAYSYTLDVSNLGPSTATMVSVVDTLPAGVGFVSASGTGWTCGFMAPNVTCTRASLGMGSAPIITINVTAPNEGGMISNSATVSANEADPVPGNNSDSEGTTITPRADISVTKTDGVTSAVPGQSVVYTIVATNGGPSTDPSVSVADTFPGIASCSWTSMAAGGASGNTNNAGPANLSDTLNMPPGSSVTYSATCAIAASATGTLSNTATVTASITDPVGANNSASDMDTLTPQADVAVTKTDGVTSATPGGQVTYTITVTNNGPSNDPSVGVADTFPASLSCGWTSMASGGATGNSNNAGPASLADTLSMPASSSVTYTATCDIAPDATGTLSNTATGTASVTDPTPGNNSATDNDTALAAQSDLSITKTDGVTSAVPGQQLVYTIVVSNGGPSTDASAAVADTFPGSLSCGWTSMAAGGATGNTNNAGPANLADTLSLPPSSSVTYTVTCDIAPGATGTLSNTATVTASATDPMSGNDSATDNDTNLTPQADLSITKTDGVTVAAPGGQVVYTVVASNAGPSTDPSASVADTFPATLTCGWTSMAAGGATGNTNNAGPANLSDTLSLPPSSSVTYTVTCDIDSGASGTLSNTATITASVTDGTPGNNSATDMDTLTAQADVSITKTDGSPTAVPGSTVVYTIVASNSGPSPDPSVGVADTFPGVLSCGWTSMSAGGATGNSNNAGPANLSDTLSMPSGSSVTYTVTCSIAADATGSLMNTATVTPSVTDPNGGNNSATDTDTLTPQANVAITKTDGVASAVPGSSVAYTITASNAGPSTATSVTVADTFPAVLTCTWTSSAGGGATGNDAGAAGNINDSGITLPPSASVTYTANCDIDSAATGMLSNTATVSSGVTDLVPGNNSATDTDTLDADANLSITKTDGVTSAVPGNQVVYTIVAANAGPSTATSVQVSDTFPASLTCNWTSSSSGGASGNDTPGSGDIADNGITLPPSSSVTYTVTCDIDPSATGSLMNTASVSSAVTDSVPGNNSATDTDTLTPQADLEVTKTAVPPTGPLMGGQGLVYTITVVNLGPSTATGVTVTDALPTGTNTPSTAGDCSEGSPAVPTCTLGTILPGMGNAKSYTLSVTVDAPPPASITNTATVAGNETDPVPGNNSDSVTHSNDLVPPAVASIDTVPGDGSLDSCETVRKYVTAITVVFDEAMQFSGGVPGPDDADNPDNYLLVSTGADLDFSTVACGPPQGDDVQIPVTSVDYSGTTATLHLGPALADGLYRFFACSAGLHDLGGNELDGDDNGTGGDDFVIDQFRIDRDNLLANGHFDCNVTPWTQTPPASWLHDATADAPGSPLSGSAQVPSTSGTSFALDQCVVFGAFPPTLPFRMSLRFQLNASGSTAVGLIYGCSFFSDGACAGPAVPAGARVDAAIVSGATGVWSTERSFNFVRPASGASARCGLSIENPAHKTFSARTDVVVLKALDHIFSDGFESGDTSAWSAVAP